MWSPNGFLFEKNNFNSFCVPISFSSTGHVVLVNGSSNDLRMASWVILDSTSNGDT